MRPFYVGVGKSLHFHSINGICSSLGVSSRYVLKKVRLTQYWD